MTTVRVCKLICTSPQLRCFVTVQLLPSALKYQLLATQNVAWWSHFCLCAMQAPAKDSKQLYLGFAALEEQYGLSRSAMEVYDKAVQGVPPNERLEVYTIYVAKATQFFGVGKVRVDVLVQCLKHHLAVIC